MSAKSRLIAAVLGMGLGSVVALAPALGAPDFLNAAVADPHRPDADRARDASRKPAEVLAFADLKPGDTVLELIPARGYFTRIFSAAVGPKGRIYAASSAVNPETGKPSTINPLAGDPAYANVDSVAITFKPDTAIPTPKPVDRVFTAQNYHDLHLSKLGMYVSGFDRRLFAALKPGGVLIIEDHAAETGSGLRDVDHLHRIDEAAVKAEVEGAGFVFEGESDILRNPADPRTKLVFDPSIRGHTDQFLLKFRKPLSTIKR